MEVSGLACDGLGFRVYMQHVGSFHVGGQAKIDYVRLQAVTPLVNMKCLLYKGDSSIHKNPKP